LFCEICLRIELSEIPNAPICSGVQISLPANSIYGVKQGIGNMKGKSSKIEDFEDFSETLKHVSMNVSWHQLQKLQSVLHKTQTKRFAGN
jgi:hypothetical protein